MEIVAVSTERKNTGLVSHDDFNNTDLCHISSVGNPETFEEHGSYASSVKTVALWVSNC